MRTKPEPEEDDPETDRLIDEMFALANPNPLRVGCPPRVVLFDLANRIRGIGDPWWKHLTACSPCYREFMAMRENGEGMH